MPPENLFLIYYLAALPYAATPLLAVRAPERQLLVLVLSAASAPNLDADVRRPVVTPLCRALFAIE